MGCWFCGGANQAEPHSTVFVSVARVVSQEQMRVGSYVETSSATESLPDIQIPRCAACAARFEEHPHVKAIPAGFHASVKRG